jgi:uncharacterized protein (TIGR03435 family)
VVAILLAIGLIQTQVLPPAPKYGYEVVSIKPSAKDELNIRIGPGPQGGLRTTNTPVMALLTFAYDLRDYQFVNVPQWVKTERFDVSFTPDTPEQPPSPDMKPKDAESLFDRHRQRMQKILLDRFGLELREETRELPMYALVLAKGGSKMTPGPENHGPNMRGRPGVLESTGSTMRMLSNALAGIMGRAVVDETGLQGGYNFKLEWTPDSAIPGPDGADAKSGDVLGSSIFSASQEQLGLKLEAKKGPVPVVVIHKIERPTAN